MISEKYPPGDLGEPLILHIPEFECGRQIGELKMYSLIEGFPEPHYVRILQTDEDGQEHHFVLTVDHLEDLAKAARDYERDCPND